MTGNHYRNVRVGNGGYTSTSKVQEYRAAFNKSLRQYEPIIQMPLSFAERSRKYASRKVEALNTTNVSPHRHLQSMNNQ